MAVAWADDENGIHLGRYDLAGGSIGAATVISAAQAAMAGESFVLAVDGGLLVFWRDWRKHAGGDIYYKRVVVAP